MQKCKQTFSKFVTFTILDMWCSLSSDLIIILSQSICFEMPKPEVAIRNFIFKNTNAEKKKYNINPAADFQCIFLLFCLCISNLFFELRGGTSAPFSLLKTSVFFILVRLESLPSRSLCASRSPCLSC